MRTGMSNRGGSYFKGTSKSCSGATSGTTYKDKGKVASGYKNCCNDFQYKWSSFKTLWNQTQGTAKCTRPSPATLNTFSNWINKGAVVHTVRPTQINKWAKAFKGNYNCTTVSGCRSFLNAKYSKSCIKAVCKDKNGAWMIATTPTYQGKSFCFPC